MTLVHVVSAALFLTMVVGGLLLHRYLRRTVDDADGVIDLNMRGAEETQDEGTCVGVIGVSSDFESVVHEAEIAVRTDKPRS